MELFLTNQSAFFIKVSRWINFIGIHSIKNFSFGLIVGLLVFIIESLFAITIQQLLVINNIANKSNYEPYLGIEKLNLIELLYLISALAIARGIFMWANLYLTRSTFEHQKGHQRLNLLSWALKSKSTSSKKAITLYNEHSIATANVFQFVQKLTIQLPVTILLLINLYILMPIPTIFSILVVIVFGLSLKFLDSRISEIGKRVGYEAESSNELLIKNINNLQLLRIYGTQNIEIEKAKFYINKYTNHILDFGKIVALKFTLPQSIGIILVCGVAYFTRTYNDTLNPIFFSYFYLFIRCIQSFADSSSSIGSIRFFSQQVLELKSTLSNFKTEMQNKLLKKPNFDVDSGPLGWSANSLSFRFENSEADLFRDLTFQILPGQIFVIHGKSGVGKSTLLNLIIGLDAPSSGSIYLHSDSKKLSLGDLNDSHLCLLGYVGPESFIHEGTIRDNVLYGITDSPSDTEILEAARTAECEFIESISDLGRNITSQGMGLSAGQKQRISLARALLRKPKALILDEATSNLDLETEKKICKTLLTLKKSMTIIVVTHRQEILKFADHTLALV